MKQTFFFLLSMSLAVLNTSAQVGVGVSGPVDGSAKLQVDAANKGFLAPRVELTATNVAAPVTSPATGLLVFNTVTAGSGATAVSPGFYYYSGTAWVRLIVPTDNVANVTGTVAVANGGTGSSTGSITGTGALTFSAGGTNQNVTLAPSGTGSTILNGNVGVGTTSPNAKLDVRTTPTSISDPGAGYVGIGTTAVTAAAAGAGALAYTNSTGGKLVFSNGSVWNTLQSIDQKVVVTGYFTNGTTYPAGASSTLTSTETSDAFNVFSGNTFTAPRTGLYLVTANLLTTLRSWQAGEELDLAVNVGGINKVVSAYFSQVAASGAYGGPNISAVISMNANQTATFSTITYQSGFTTNGEVYNQFSITEL